MVHAFVSASAGAAASPARCGNALPQRHASSCGSMCSDSRSSGYDSLSNSNHMQRISAEFDDAADLFKPCETGMSWVMLAEEAAAEASSTGQLETSHAQLTSRGCRICPIGCRCACVDSGMRSAQREAACDQGPTSLERQLSQKQLQHEEQLYYNARRASGGLLDTFVETRAVLTITPPVQPAAPAADVSSWSFTPPPPPPVAPTARRPACASDGPASRAHYPHRGNTTCSGMLQPPFRPAAPPPPLARPRFRPLPVAVAGPSRLSCSPPPIPVPLSFERSQPQTPATTAAGSPPQQRPSLRDIGATEGAFEAATVEVVAAAGCPRVPRENKMLSAVMRYYETVRVERARRPPGKPAEPQRVVVGFAL